MTAVGEGLAKGLFVDEVCKLIDRTDQVCQAEAEELRSTGDRIPVSRIFQASYTQSAAPTDGHGLAASYVVRAFELASMMTRFKPSRRPAGLASFANNASARSWGRYYLALLSLDPQNVSDQALFASLLHRAWNAGGYHLQLQALQTAQFFVWATEPHRSEILEVVNALDTEHWALRSTIVEVLAGFGEIKNPTTVEELQGHIRATISYPHDTNHCQAASSIVNRQFEDQDIVGPYFTAVDGLTNQEKTRLFTMAARGDDPSIALHLRWTLNRLTELVPTGDATLDTEARSVFMTFLNGPPENAFIPAEAAAACLAAIRGWAKFELALPLQPRHLTPVQRNWRLLANILLGHERNDAATNTEETWSILLEDPQQTIRTLATLDRAAPSSVRDPRGPKPHALKRLIEDHPEPLRRLFEWALENSADVAPNRLQSGVNEVDKFVLRMLGAVGDETTAARLHVHALDPDTGQEAVTAIRQIYRRITP